MMRGILSESVFRDGLIDYLIHFSYDNADTDNLWEILTAVSFKNALRFRQYFILLIFFIRCPGLSGSNFHFPQVVEENTLLDSDELVVFTGIIVITVYRKSRCCRYDGSHSGDFNRIVFPRRKWKPNDNADRDIYNHC